MHDRFCRARGLAMTAYSPLGSPDSAALLGRKEDTSEPSLMNHPVVTNIAANRGKSPAQVLVRWSLNRGIAVLPKSVSPERIHANLHGALGWSLTDAEMKELSSISHQRRAVDGSFWISPVGPYKTLEEFWA